MRWLPMMYTVAHVVKETVCFLTRDRPVREVCREELYEVFWPPINTKLGLWTDIGLCMGISLWPALQSSLKVVRSR